MALIGKIRSNQKILMVFIGLAMVLFVVDPSTIYSKLTGGGEQPIGTIYEKNMLDSEWNYEKRVEFAANNYRYQKKQVGQEPILNDQETEQVRNQVWSQMIMDTLFNTEFAKLGIDVSPGELNESLLYGANPHTSLKEQFSYGTIDPATGEEVNKIFVRDSLIKNLNKFINNTNQETKRQLKNLEDQITNERIKEKYFGMVKYGLTGTTEDANRNYAETSTTASIKYVFKDYATIPDSVVNVTDEDLRKYFDEHRFEKKWKQEVEMRSFQYVTFDITPSRRDMKSAVLRLEKSKPGFEVAQNDSLFVSNNAYSANNMGGIDVLPASPYEGGNFPMEYDAQILSSKKGDVIGPFSDGKNVMMVKVTKTGSREEIKARNIYLSTNGMDASVKAKKKRTLDSLFRVVKLDTSKFTELAATYSDDFISRNNRGIHDWSPKGKVHADTKFETFCFSKPIGSLEIVETENGLHIIHLLGRQVNDFQYIAIVDAKVNASKATRDSIYDNIALPIYSGIKDNGFEKTIEEAGLTPRESNNIRIDYPQLSGLPKNMSIIKWAFNSEVGAVMQPEDIDGNTKLVVAYLTDAMHEGDPEFESTKEIMRSEVIKEKKGEYITNQLSGAGSLDDAAAKIGVAVSNAELVLSMDNFPDKQANPQNQSVNEAGIIGQVFALDQGVMSAPMVGEFGVYTIVVDNKVMPQKSEDISTYKGMVTGSLRSQVDNRLIQALYNASKAKDWRMKRTVINR